MTLPNILTFIRLALIPVIIGLLYMGTIWATWLALVLYIAGALTDFLDGWIARKYDQVTELGKMMDPIADKIFVSVIMLTLMAIQRIDGVWALVVMIIVCREFIVAGLREYLGPKNIKLPVTVLAKWKTTAQMIATGILIVAPLIPFGYTLGLSLLAIAGLLTIMTGTIYMKAGLKSLSE